MNPEDLHKAYLLLEIIEKCAGHTGRFSAISNAAMNDLAVLNDRLRSEAMAAEQQRRDDAERAAADAIDAENMPRSIPSSSAGGDEPIAADGIRRL